MKKIAILGNMNNNGFSLLRYFRDLGFNADLLLFKNDVEKNVTDFTLEADTWYLEKWVKYIKYLPAVNGYGQALSKSSINKILLYIVYYLRKAMHSKNALYAKPASKRDLNKLKHTISGYDIIIGSGATPAILYSINYKLDLFFPYSQGIEFLYEDYFFHYRKSKFPLVKYIAHQMFKMQEKGIIQSKVCLTVNEELTNQAYKKIGVNPKTGAVPIVYPYEIADSNSFSNGLKKTLEFLLGYDYLLISHGRHLWKKPQNFTSDQWELLTKNNNWIIEAYKRFLLDRPKSNSVLIFFEYGEDFEESKLLCDQEKLSKNVIWLPKMKRKEIFEVLKYCSVGLGEFYQSESFFGGCGWEIISNGLPLIHGYKRDIDSFQIDYGYTAPPFYIANSIDSIHAGLIEFYDNKKYRLKIGEDSKAWFNSNNGHQGIKNILKFIK